ncbi:MAG: hypothetical protein QM656_16055 [Paracoccaceae bacterium]
MFSADALLGAGTSLLGGLLGGNKYKSWIGREEARNQWFNLSGDKQSKNYYDALRRGAESAGFNPLAVMGVNVPQVSGQMTSNQYMGAAIADAGMILADSLSKNKAAQQVSTLQAQNAKMAEQIQSLTLRPKVGGIYALPQAVPTMRAALTSTLNSPLIVSASALS